MSGSLQVFRDRVAEALEAIPPGFKPYLDNVEILVQEWPEDSLLESLGIPPEEGLYGIYLGTPLTERGSGPADLPDRILIFRGPLEEDFPDPEDLREEVGITIVHEIAHHFGIGEERLQELGWD